MFAGIPHDLFRVHNWRTDVGTVGVVPASFIQKDSQPLEYRTYSDAPDPNPNPNPNPQRVLITGLSRDQGGLPYPDQQAGTLRRCV